MTVIIATIWFFFAAGANRLIQLLASFPIHQKSSLRSMCHMNLLQCTKRRHQGHCCTFCRKLFFMSLKCPVFRTSSCECTYSNGINTTSYSIALKFLSMTVVLMVFAYSMLWYSPQNFILFADSTRTFFITNLASIKKVGLKKVGLVLPWLALKVQENFWGSEGFAWILFWSLIIFGHLSFTTVRGQKIGFNRCECIQFSNNSNVHALHVWGKRILIWNDRLQHFSFIFFYFFASAMQLLSTPVTSSNLRNDAPLFTELRVLQGT